MPCLSNPWYEDPAWQHKWTAEQWTRFCKKYGIHSVDKKRATSEVPEKEGEDG